MEAIIQYLLTGLSAGSVYGLIALGFYVMWSAAKAVNFTYGEMFMLGGVLTVVLMELGLPLPLAAGLAIASAAAAGLVGIDADRITLLAVAIGEDGSVDAAGTAALRRK